MNLFGKIVAHNDGNYQTIYWQTVHATRTKNNAKSIHNTLIDGFVKYAFLILIK